MVRRFQKDSRSLAEGTLNPIPTIAISSFSSKLGVESMPLKHPNVCSKKSLILWCRLLDNDVIVQPADAKRIAAGTSGMRRFLHSFGVVETVAQRSSQGISGLGSRKFPVGGITFCSSALIAFINPAIPAASPAVTNISFDGPDG